MRELTLIGVSIVCYLGVNAQAVEVTKKPGDKGSAFQYDRELDYYFCLPLKYHDGLSRSKKFPLVIYLHGGGGYGKINGLDYLGYSDSLTTEDPVAENFQKKYPSFILVPQSKRGWDAGKLIPIVEQFKSTHPVDEKRIYLIGYSMGGSGSYVFINGYYDHNQTLFAAIIRLAGQSQTTLRDPIAHILRSGCTSVLMTHPEE
jgi:predicted peptidase